METHSPSSQMNHCRNLQHFFRDKEKVYPPLSAIAISVQPLGPNNRRCNRSYLSTIYMPPQVTSEPRGNSAGPNCASSLKRETYDSESPITLTATPIVTSAVLSAEERSLTARNAGARREAATPAGRNAPPLGGAKDEYT